MDVMAGTVTSIYDEKNGLVEVHLDGAPNGQTVITQSAAGLTYIGARVRVSRGSDGAATMAHAPTVRAPRGTPTVAVGETGRALQDLTGKYNALADTSAPVLGWDSGIRATGYDVPPTYWARLPLFEGGAGWYGGDVRGVCRGPGPVCGERACARVVDGLGWADHVRCQRAPLRRGDADERVGHAAAR